MDGPVVTIKQGQLKGCIRNDIDGGEIITFLGVPFAKPPIGELRFKAPLPAEPWDGVKDATKDGSCCYARDLLLSIVTESENGSNVNATKEDSDSDAKNPLLRGIDGSEDCLNLNIYTKSLPEYNKALKPVMVFIHGGAFVTGSNKPAMYGPEFLLTQDIVLVTINYRLGALGFLSSDDLNLGVPGNAGLKDQVLALKWVQENIRNFNGDPDNVTIFGESAGSGSVHFLVLSPTAKDLFHKAIMQSGCALNHWAQGQQIMIGLAKELGHDVSTDREALEILKDVPVESLYAAQERFEAARKLSSKMYFAPVIEKPNDTAFITENVFDIIRSGNYNKVPLIFGYNSREGLMLSVIEAMATMLGKPKETKKDAPNMEDSIPWQIGLERGSEISKEVCQKLTKLYFAGPNLTENACLMATDTIFVSGIIAAVKNHAKTSQNPVYLYRLSLDAGLNILKIFAKLNSPGACHGDDIGYLFKTLITPPIKPGSIEDVSVRRIVKLWTNFAKYGNPTPDDKELGVAWKPVERGNVNFIDIGEDLVMEVNPEPERMELWREIYQLNPKTAGFL